MTPRLQIGTYYTVGFTNLKYLYSKFEYLYAVDYHNFALFLSYLPAGALNVCK